MNYKEFKSTDFEDILCGDKINARVLELDTNKIYKVFVFREKVDVYSCLLPVNNTNSKLPELKGLIILYQQFKMLGSELKPYILLECRTLAYLVNFIEILKEIIAEFDKGKYEVVKCVHLVISKWRYFLSEPTKQIISEEEIIGLMGELMLLDKMIPVFNKDAIDFWAAGRGEEDFIGNNKIVEVKVTLADKHQHIINGIDQLLIIPDQKKYILSLLFVKSESDNSLTLTQIINDCSLKIADFPEANDSFFKKIKSRGYDPRDAALYSDYKYSCIKGGYFHVANSFPKLTVDELKMPLNSRISKVRYTLDLEGMANDDFQTTEIKKVF